MKTRLLIASATILGSTALAGAQEIATWKGFRACAVTYSFDDNWGNQIDFVKSAMDKYGYKATFNVVTQWVSGGNSHNTTWNSWKEMANNGHEIASHTDSHQQQTPSNELGSSQKTIQQQTGKECITIAYPNCNIPQDRNTLQSTYISGRVCNGQIEGKSPRDWYNIGSIICGNLGINSSNEFISKMNQAKNQGGWVTFLIHGVDNGDYSPTSSNALKQSVDHIVQNDKDFWCCTFVAATKYIKERDAAKATVKSQDASVITISLTDNLDDKIYNEALSLRIELPDGWDKVEATQAGEEINAEIKNGYIYFDAVPDAGDIELTSGAPAIPDPMVTLSPSDDQTWDPDTEYEISWTIDGEVAKPFSLVWSMGSTSTSSLIDGSSASATSEWANDEGTFSWGVDNILSDDGTGGESARWGSKESDTEPTVTIKFSKTETLGGIYIDEFTKYGTIEAFKVEAADGSKWNTVYEGTTVGERFSATFDPVSTNSIRVVITKFSGVNINYIAGLPVTGTTIKTDITASGKISWKVPAAYAGKTGTISLNKANGKAIAQSGKIKITGTQTGGDEPQPGTVTNGGWFDANGAYFGPSCEEDGKESNLKGAYYTGIYRNMFVDYLGKTQEEVDAKMEKMWQHYFEGSNKLYNTYGTNEAYILDSGNNDVRSEGQSYGMMIAVQTDHKEVFDKLWRYAKNHMLHTSGDNAGYFSWQMNVNNATPKDQGCAPDGEMYFVTSLLFASNRWGNDGEIDYNKDAQFLLKNWVKGGINSLFNESEHVITFQPSYGNYTFSDPSYDLPGFVELFARWSETNNDFWRKCVTATRAHLVKASHSSSGLFTDYCNFDGTPKRVDFNEHAHQYMYDAMRCATNVGMDYNWFGADAENQATIMGRLINHFEKDGYKHARFEWDGTPVSGNGDGYTLGEAGANAVGCFALTGDPANETKIKTNLNKAWSGTLMTGQWRYYDGLVHYLAMLNLSGNFKIWKPKPVVKEKTVKGNGSVEYDGVKYTEDTEIIVFEDCEVYNVKIQVEGDASAKSVKTSVASIVPNPARGSFSVVTDEDVLKVAVYSTNGKLETMTNGASTVDVSSLQQGTYIVKVETASGSATEKLIVIK